MEYEKENQFGERGAGSRVSFAAQMKEKFGKVKESLLAELKRVVRRRSGESAAEQEELKFSESDPLRDSTSSGTGILIGRVPQSVNEALERKFRATSRSGKMLAKIRAEFSAFTDAMATATGHFCKVSQLLDEFGELCDSEIGTETTESGSPGLRRSTSGKRNSLPQVGQWSPTLSRDTLTADCVRRLDGITEEMTETIDVNGTRLLSTGAELLREQRGEARNRVARAAIEYDLARNQLAALEAEVEGVSDALIRTSSEPITSALPSLLKRDHLTAELAELALQCNNQRALCDELSAEYHAACRAAEHQLLFALEQMSVTTWTSYSVLYAQMARYFEEFREINQALAGTVLSLKNSQTVSKALGIEKQRRMNRNFREAERRLELPDLLDISDPLPFPLRDGTPLRSSAAPSNVHSDDGVCAALTSPDVLDINVLLGTAPGRD